MHKTAGWIVNMTAFVLGLFLIVYAAAFGFYPSWVSAWRRVESLISDTLHAVNLRQLYFGASWLHTLFTLRLVFLALVFAYGLAVLLTVFPARVRFRPFVAAFEAVSVFLESIPDTLYIVFLVVLVVLMIEHTGIDIPAFNDANPTWVSSLIPALALALPAGFYLRRVWTLQLQDEQRSLYIRTALSKGASTRRVFYRHLLPNLGPSALSELPFVAAMILSTSLFTELFMEYKGQLFQFTQAVGISMEQGDLANPYHTGAIFVIGLVLMLLWWVSKWLSDAGMKMLYPADLVRNSAAGERRMARGWIILGAAMIAVILFCGTFPHLFTPFSPNYRDMSSLYQNGPPFQPLPPSAKHPFGTDTLGRDVLADTLYGVFPTLLPAVVITLLTVLAGVAVAVAASVSERRWLVSTLQLLSRCLSSIPSLFLLFLVLYQRINIEWLQLVQYILWFVLIESPRSSYAVYQSIQAWFQFSFTEGAYSLGRTRWEILFVHLKSWLGRYLLEFSCSTFVRIMSLMTQLAALHVYVQVTIGQLPFKQFDEQMWPVGIISYHFTWFGMIGDSALSMNFLTDPAYLAAPVIALGLTVVGMNLIARGLRGGASAI